MNNAIELALTTRAVFPVPAGEYHYRLMDMEQAFALEAALKEQSGFLGDIQRAIHPALYPKANPNPYYKDGINPHQGVAGFRFTVPGAKNIREAYQVVFGIIEKTIGTTHDLQLNEVSVSRMGVSREDRYHPLYNPQGESSGTSAQQSPHNGFEPPQP